MHVQGWYLPMSLVHEWLKKLLASVFIVVLLALTVVVLMGVAAWLYISGRAKPKDVIELAGLVVTGLGSVLAYLSSYFVRLQQEQHDSELENVKHEHTIEIARIQNNLDAVLHNMSERINQFTRREYEAYDVLWKAASKYYVLLESLGRGQFQNELFGAPYKALESAYLYDVLIAKPDQEAFYDYRAVATTIADKADKIKTDPAELKKFWDEHRKKVSTKYQRVERQFASRLRPPLIQS